AWPGPEIRVRIGLHTGTADERDGDYFGPTLNRAARVMSAGHGGHVLVSTTTAQLLQARIGPAATLVDRGSHRLAGVTDEERIFEVVHPAAPAADRPLRTREFRPTNLEAPLSSFVGRSKELEDIARRLDSHRLV